MDNSGSPYGVQDDLGTGRLVVVGLSMAAANVEEVDMPMGEAAEDDAVVGHGSLVVVVAASRAAAEVLGVENGQMTFVQKM